MLKKTFLYFPFLKVSQLPEKDELNWSKSQLLARLDVSMGGRVAEELIFGKENITTGSFWYSLKILVCCVFPRFLSAERWLHVFSLSFDWFTGLSVSFMIG